MLTLTDGAPLDDEEEGPGFDAAAGLGLSARDFTVLSEGGGIDRAYRIGRLELSPGGDVTSVPRTSKTL